MTVAIASKLTLSINLNRRYVFRDGFVPIITSMTGRLIEANGITIAYDEFGDRADPSILLVMGLGTQMIAWPEAFCRDLANRGFHVLRFDNRDVGLSEKFDGAAQPNIMLIAAAAFMGLPTPVPYTLDDMTLDAVGLLNALGIQAVHIVGVSLGGMISQLFAANHPERCLSLTSIMSSSGRRGLPGAHPRVSKQLLNRPTSGDRRARVAHSMKTYELIGSPGFPPDKTELEARIHASLDRSDYPYGHFRQLAASMAYGSRVGDLKRITAPTLVLHGTADPLIPVAHGIDTARWIADARLELIDGWGHDLPRQLLPRLAAMIAEHARSVSGGP